MNILIHSHLFPNPVKPALGTFVFFSTQALVELGHSVTVVAPIPYVPPIIPPNHPWYQYKFVPLNRREGKVLVYHPRFLSIPRRRLFYLRGDLMYYSAKNFYARLFEENRFDVIHCHVALPDAVVGLRLSRKHRIPYGVTIHGADFYESIPESRLNFLKIKQVIEGASFVGLVSQRLQRLMTRHGISPEQENSRVIYNGISIPNNIQEVLWQDGDPRGIRLLSVGHAIKRKGIEYVLRAIANLRRKYSHLYYYVIGDGVDLNYFRKIAREVGVDDITYFLGAMPNSLVFGYMKACDIFVLPSWNEAFGVVFIEAMYSRAIVLGPRGEGIEEIIKEGENGFLVQPKEVEALQDKIDFIVSRLDRLDKIRENARNSVWPRFTWRHNALKYLELYQSVLL